MKITRFNDNRIAVVVDDEHLVDITDLLGVDTAEWPPVGPTRLVAEFDAWRPRIEAALPGLPRVAVRDVTLRTPIPWPNKVIAYPVNYHDHGREMQAGYRADHQGFFLKPNSSLSGAGEPVVLPNVPSREVHHEAAGAIQRRGAQQVEQRAAAEVRSAQYLALLRHMPLRGDAIGLKLAQGLGQTARGDPADR